MFCLDSTALTPSSLPSPLQAVGHVVTSVEHALSLLPDCLEACAAESTGTKAKDISGTSGMSLVLGGMLHFLARHFEAIPNQTQFHAGHVAAQATHLLRRFFHACPPAVAALATTNTTAHGSDASIGHSIPNVPDLAFLPSYARGCQFSLVGSAQLNYPKSTILSN